MTKLGLISDPHASAAPVAEALAIFDREQVDAIWCTGDIAGYGNELEATINLLAASPCQAICGNHERWLLEQKDAGLPAGVSDYLRSLPAVIEQEMEGRLIYMVHASPPRSDTDGIRLLDQDGELIDEQKAVWAQRLAEFVPDVLIIGHTHQAFAEWLGQTMVINPGSSCYNHSCAILHIPSVAVQWFGLSGQHITKSWNWGAQYRKDLV
jgi:putative phosphoesterase